MNDVVKKGMEAEKFIRDWHRAIGAPKADIIGYDLIALVQYVINRVRKEKRSANEVQK